MAPFTLARVREEKLERSGGQKEREPHASIEGAELDHPEQPIHRLIVKMSHSHAQEWFWAQPSIGRQSTRVHTHARTHTHPTSASLSLQPRARIARSTKGCPNTLEFQINSGDSFTGIKPQLSHETSLYQKSVPC